MLDQLTLRAKVHDLRAKPVLAKAKSPGPQLKPLTTKMACHSLRLKPRSSEPKTAELKPTVSETKRKDRVGAQGKPSASMNCWTIRAEAQYLRGNG